MQMAQIVGGYSLGGADLLRRAMGKKVPAEMAKHREIFREGAAKDGVGEAKADAIFDLMEKFAGYGFNKSRRRLRAGELPDRLAQAPLPGRVHGRDAVFGHGQHRKGGRIPG